MNLFSTPEFKVGFLVIVVSGLIGVMSLKVAEGPGLLTGNKQYWFTLPDAGGLVKNSAVKMAGIKVGVIEDIKLEKGRARLKVRLDGDARVTGSTKVVLKADGILGDKHIELTPGDEAEEVLADGSEIRELVDRAGIQEVMEQFGSIADTLNDLAKTLTTAVKGDGDSSSAIGRIVLNIEKLTKDLSEVTGENKGKLNELITRLNNIARSLEENVGPESLAHLGQSLRNIEEITDKVNKGQGTLGRLINDEKTVDELNSAITSVNSFLSGANRIQTSVDFHTEYLTDLSATKSFLGVKIQPGLDRYYEIQVVDDPRGVSRSEIDETSVNNGPVTTTDTTKTFQNKIRITALFAKNFYDFTIKAGLIESAGGFGVDYYLFDRNLRMSAEFFDFRDLYIRSFLRYYFLKGVYITAGGDNLASSRGSVPSAFVGAGIFITNDDLKLLASRITF